MTSFSASNVELWSHVLQFMYISAALLAGNFLRRRIPFLRKALLPVSIIAGFLLLGVRELGLLDVDLEFMESITYHAIAIGFIALALRVDPPKADDRQRAMGFKSGLTIVGSYLIQAIAGLSITLLLSYTLYPNLFRAAGILLPMGFGQGPGQANNIGTTYEYTYGFAGGQSFGLAIATIGFLWACFGGILYLLAQKRRGKLSDTDIQKSEARKTVAEVESPEEIPLVEAIDKFSIQVALIFGVYLLTYLFSLGLTSLFSAISEGLANTLNALIWGFNFLIGSSLALLIKKILRHLKRANLMKHQYQNNYMLNRISGTAFDFMVVASIVAIQISALKELWVPLLLLTTVGGIVTIFFVSFVSRRIYKGYYLPGFLSMYGMMTGTISTGVLLLREVDPEFTTPASDNLIIGTSTAVVMAAPMLVLVGLAPKSETMTFIVLAACIVYFAAVMFFLLKKPRIKKK